MMEDEDLMIPKAVEYKGTGVFRWANFEVWTLGLVAVVPSLGGLLFGYDIGATSYALAQLEEGSTTASVKWADAVASSAVLKGTFAAASVAGALCASAAVFEVADAIGRLGEMLAATILFLIGIVLIMASGMSSLSESVPGGLGCVLVGKFCFGLGCGLASHAAPTYVAEMAPASLRGYMVAFKEAMMSAGVLLGYAIGFAYRKTTLGWVAVYASAMPFACAYGLGVSVLPFSARWLVYKGRISEARAALARIHRDPDALRRTLDEIVTNERAERVETYRPASVVEEAKASAAVRGALKAALGCIVLQQFSGQPSVLYFATTLFRRAGVTTAAPVIVASVKLVATVYSVVLVEKRGRRKLLLAGTATMATALFVLALALATNYSAAAVYYDDDVVDGALSDDDDLSASDNATNATVSFITRHLSSSRRPAAAFESSLISSSSSSSNATSWTPGPPWRRRPEGHHPSASKSTGKAAVGAMDLVSIGSMIGAVVGYQIGFGPISWLLLSELFASHLRARVVALGVQINFAANILVSLVFPSMVDYLGAALTFVVFAFVCVYAYAFISRFVPETRGLSLEEIQHVLVMLPRTEDGALPENGGAFRDDDYDDNASDDLDPDDLEPRRAFEPPFAGFAHVVTANTPLVTTAVPAFSDDDDAVESRSSTDGTSGSSHSFDSPASYHAV